MCIARHDPNPVTNPILSQCAPQRINGHFSIPVSHFPTHLFLNKNRKWWRQYDAHNILSNNCFFLLLLMQHYYLSLRWRVNCWNNRTWQQMHIFCIFPWSCSFYSVCSVRINQIPNLVYNYFYCNLRMFWYKSVMYSVLDTRLSLLLRLSSKIISQ